MFCASHAVPRYIILCNPFNKRNRIRIVGCYLHSVSEVFALLTFCNLTLISVFVCSSKTEKGKETISLALGWSFSWHKITNENLLVYKKTGDGDGDNRKEA